MRVDWVAVLPEVILTLAICGVLIADLFLTEKRRGLLTPLSLAGIGATFVAVVNLWGDERSTLGGMFVVDQFAVLFKGLFCLAALLVVVISHEYLKDDDIHRGEYQTMLLSALLGMLTIASSRDLVAIFVSLELISLPTFVLAGLRKSDLKSNEAALKFFLFGVLSTTIMLFGMSLIYGITGATNLGEISRALASNVVLQPLAVLSIFFIIAGFGFKISAFPFQWWVPDTYEGSPVPVAAFLSVASKTAGFVGLLQIMFIGFGELADVWRPFLGLIAVLTMTFGNLVALQQRHLIRMLAYSSISQAGYMLLPLGVASAQNPSLNRQAMQAATVYLLIYAFMETGAFTTAIAFGRRGNGYMISDYAGLFSRAPALATAMAVFLFSLAGVPPLGGWAAKFFVLRAVINGGGYWLAGAMVINTVISLYYYAAVVRRMFFDAPAAQRPVPVPVLLAGSIAILAVVVVATGILPETFGRLAANATLRL